MGRLIFAGWNYGGNKSDIDQAERALLCVELGLAVLCTFGWPESTRKQMGMIKKLKADGRLVFAGWEGAHCTDADGRKEKSDMTFDLGLANLMSFADRGTEKMLDTIKGVKTEKPNPRAKIFLDSGAFSVHSRGGVINLDEYCAFIQEHIDTIDYFFNLDVIPTERTPAGYAAAAAQGKFNWERMQDAGFSPIHTFHYGEPVDYLRSIVRHALDTMEEPYIAIGGAARVQSGVRHEWLRDAVWPELVNPDGTPKLKVHGLAITNLHSLWAFPWASADSTSWLVSSYNGEIAYWEGEELKWHKASGRHRQGWHDFTLEEKARIAEMLGQDSQDFATLPYRAQMSIFVRHNIEMLLRAEAKIPAILPAASRGRRRLIG